MIAVKVSSKRPLVIPLSALELGTFQPLPRVLKLAASIVADFATVLPPVPPNQVHCHIQKHSEGGMMALARIER